MCLLTEHPAIVGSYTNLGSLCAGKLKAYEDAQKYFEKAVEVALLAVDSSHPMLIRARLNLANVIRLRGRSEEAIAILDSAAKQAKVTEENMDAVVHLYVRLAELCMDIGNYTQVRASAIIVFRLLLTSAARNGRPKVS